MHRLHRQSGRKKTGNQLELTRTIKTTYYCILLLDCRYYIVVDTGKRGEEYDVINRVTRENAVFNQIQYTRY